MTQEEFNKLPGLIRLGLVMEITGLNSLDVRQAVEAGELRVYHAKGNKTRRGKGSRKKSWAFYYKAEVGKLAGFKL